MCVRCGNCRSSAARQPLGVVATLGRTRCSRLQCSRRCGRTWSWWRYPRRILRQLLAFFSPVRAMVVATALLIALGGCSAGLNTMYAASLRACASWGIAGDGYSRGRSLSAGAGVGAGDGAGRWLCGGGVALLDDWQWLSMGAFGWCRCRCLRRGCSPACCSRDRRVAPLALAENAITEALKAA